MTRRALFRESTTGAIDDGAGGSIPTVPDPSGEPDGKVLETSSGALVYGTGGTGGDVAGDTHAATSKTTPVDNDEIPLADSATSYSLKKLLWSNLKATLKTYTDTLYDATGAAAAAQAASQPLDSDLTAIAGLDASTSGAIASDGAGWIKKTYAQFKTALSLVKGDVGLGNVDNTADSAKPVSTAQQTAIDAKVTANAGISGATKTKITYDAKGLVTAGADATTADIADSTNKRYITDAQQTVIGNTSGTNTGDQTNIAGNAATATKLAASKNIDGQAFDGSADINVIAPGTHAATSKATPVDADELALVDSAASNVLKKLTWANVKATLKTYFDTLYAVAGAAPALHASTHKPGGTDALMTVIRDAGTSTSGTATTQVAAVSAAASNQLVGWEFKAAQTSAASTQIKVIITYSDATTTTITTAASTAATVLGNAGGMFVAVAGALATSPALVVNSAKAVTGIRIETAGTGTGTRGGAISAIQVPL